MKMSTRRSALLAVAVPALSVAATVTRKKEPRGAVGHREAVMKKKAKLRFSKCVTAKTVLRCVNVEPVEGRDEVCLWLWPVWRLVDGGVRIALKLGGDLEDSFDEDGFNENGDFEQCVVRRIFESQWCTSGGKSLVCNEMAGYLNGFGDGYCKASSFLPKSCG